MNIEDILNWMDEYREHEQSQIITNIPTMPYDAYNEAQRINVYNFTTKYGKQYTKIIGNVRLVRNIIDAKVNHFGSIADYELPDTFPLSYVKCKGTEIIEIQDAPKKAYRRKGVLISRRFLSKVLQTWAYMTGIRYYSEKRKDTAVYLWCQKLKVRTSNKISIIDVLTGNDTIAMIKDMLFIIRNKPSVNLKSYVSRAISENLYNLMMAQALSKKTKFENIIQQMKDRMYHVYQIYDYTWNYPKYNPEYLTGVLNELNSGNYILNAPIPIIHDLYKYPIECKDTHLKPMTNEEHEQNKDDYDLTQYVFERY